MFESAKIFAGSSDYEDITSTAGDIEGVTAVYEVKSSTGGKNNYCVHASAAGYGGEVGLYMFFS